VRFTQRGQKLALVSGFVSLLCVAAKPLEPEQVEASRRFRRATAFSYLPGRSGDIFFYPRKHSFVTFETGNYSHDGFSHLSRDRVRREVQHGGSSHGTVWDYDVEIPLLFYGPGFIPAGQRLSEAATQQDLVPTLAHLIGAVPPEDARHGRILHKALKPGVRKPRVVLTVVFDQGGWAYYRAHPQAHPYIDHLMTAGTLFTHAQVSHLDSETSVGHIAIGTGAYPYQHGIVSNTFFLAPLGRRSNLLGPDRSPLLINSASLADVWDLQTDNQAIIFSYAYADRAAIGMGGHGAMYAGGDSDIVLYYDGKKGLPTTNTRYYTLPDYLKHHEMKPYLAGLVDKDGRWFGHDVNNLEDVNKTPAQARYDTDLFLKMLAQEPIGQDQVPDLLYLTLKASDACGHAFGMETDECGEVLAEQDLQMRRIIEALEKKVGKDQFVVVLTADHGGAPLAELSGGHRISANPLKAALNEKFDQIDNGVSLVQDLTASQIYIEENELRRNGRTLEDIRQFLLNYRIGGEQVFVEVITRRDVLQEQLRLGLY
jgi:hypothetical protein